MLREKGPSRPKGNIVSHEDAEARENVCGEESEQVVYGIIITGSVEWTMLSRDYHLSIVFRLLPVRHTSRFVSHNVVVFLDAVDHLDWDFVVGQVSGK